MPNTEIYYPKSGRTVGSGNNTNKSYTSPANGEGSIVYVSYFANNSVGSNASVSINNVIVAIHSIDMTSLNECVVPSGMVNILSPLILSNGSSAPANNRFPSGFPVDKDGNPYLMLAPGDTVTVNGSNSTYVCIVALEL